MQMIKKDKAVTLMVLVVTIVVLIILAGIAVNSGMEEIGEIKDNQKEIELSMIQESIFQQYTLVKSKKQLGKVPTQSFTADIIRLEDDNGRPSDLIGSRIINTSFIESKGFDTFLKQYNNTLPYEEYYYYINKENLAELGLTQEDTNIEFEETREYIVNYSTGEVFDIANKKYYITDEPISTSATDSTINDKYYNFVD